MGNKRNKVFLFLGILFGLVTIFFFHLANNLAYNDLVEMIFTLTPKGDVDHLKRIIFALKLLNVGQLGTISLSVWAFAWYFAKRKNNKIKRK